MKTQSSLLLFAITLILPIVAGCASSDCQPLPPLAARTESVSIVLRKQFTHTVGRKRICRHIHLILADDQLIGFNSVRRDNVFKYTFMNNASAVRRLPWLRKNRRHYVDALYAQNCEYHEVPGNKMVSIWAEVRVTPEQAERLAAAWRDLEKRRPPFRLLRKNCATHAADTLVEAGILCKPIGGLGRPETVLKDLKERYGDEINIRTGYFGEDPNGGWMILPVENGSGASCRN